MLAGEPPYTGATAQAVILKRFTEPVPSVRTTRPNVPEAIDAATSGLWPQCPRTDLPARENLRGRLDPP